MKIFHLSSKRLLLLLQIYRWPSQTSARFIIIKKRSDLDLLPLFVCLYSVCCRDPAWFTDGWLGRIKTDVEDNWRLKVHTCVVFPVPSLSSLTSFPRVLNVCFDPAKLNLLPAPHRGAAPGFALHPEPTLWLLWWNVSMHVCPDNIRGSNACSSLYLSASDSVYLLILLIMNSI